MRQRLSISRLMVTIGLLCLSLSFLSSWIGPKNRFAFLGLMAWMVVDFWIAWYATSGWPRRFFGGAAITGFLLWIVVFLAPSWTLKHSWDYLVIPVARRLFTPGTLMGYEYEWRLSGLNLNIDRYFDRGYRGWFQLRTTIGLGFPDIQLILLIPQGCLTVIGGLVATIFRRKPAPTALSSAT
jgi:hypothetical protein